MCSWPNPLFGLNTLGGALSVRTRSGSFAGIEASGLAGSFGRRQGQLTFMQTTASSVLRRRELFLRKMAGATTLPRRSVSSFGRADWRGRFGVVTATALLADNDLIGNGLIPTELYDERPEAVFTSPDDEQTHCSCTERRV